MVETIRAAPPPLDPVASNAVLIAVRQAAHVLCDRTVLLILLHAQLGACRYADFSERTGLASRLLSSRLTQLEAQGLMVRIPYSRRPLRHEYYLTHMGLALFEVFALAATWEARQGGGRKGIALCVEHTTCGRRDVAVAQHCAACDGEVHPWDIGVRVSQKEIERMPAKATTMRRSTQGLHVTPRSGPTPLAHFLEVLGDKWTIEVLNCAFMRCTQYGDFLARTGISTNILADRLQRLVSADMLVRLVDDDLHRKGGYKLTEAGRSFYTVLTAIQAWADTWLDQRVRSPVKLRHTLCGHALAPTLACRHCGKGITRGTGRLWLRGARAD